MVTDTDFSVSGATAFTTISGSIEGGDTMNYTFYGDSGNQAFGRVSEIDSFGPFNSPDFSIKGKGQSASGAVGSLTNVVSLRGSGGPGDEFNGSFIATIELVATSSNVQVPDVMGDEQSAAENEIEAAGLTVGTVTNQASQVPAGHVINQFPPAGTSVGPGSPVTLIVSAGSAPPDVSNPFGLSGLWYDPALNGEGYNVLVFEGGMIVYYYGHDASGSRLWLLSETYTGAIRKGESVTLTMFEGVGTWSDPQPELQRWGTMVITFDSCAAGQVSMEGDDGSKNVSIVKLVGVGDLDCDS